MKKLLLGIFGSLLFVNVAYAAPSCQTPQKIPANKIENVDCKSDAKPDYYLFSLSWSPEHCSKSRDAFQCGLNKFDFVVHGLWPQSSTARDPKCGNPRNCSVSLVDDETIKQNLCIVPGVRLIQGEWQKHGTCAFTTAKEYYAKIRELWESLNKPNMQQLVKDKAEKLTAGDVSDQFVALNSKLGLKSEFVKVKTVDGYLSEVQICYDLKYKPIECKFGGVSSKQRIKVR